MNKEFEQKKRLCRDLRVGLCAHFVLVSIFQLAWFLSTRVVLSDFWFHLLTSTWVLSVLAILLVVLTNSFRIADTPGVSGEFRLHAASVVVLNFASTLLLDTMNSTPFAIVFYVVSIYSFLPQYLFWKRLDREIHPPKAVKQTLS